MLYHGKNGTLELDGSTMDYICFGRGEKALVMLPGLGDGLKTVKGMALPMAAVYRDFAGAYRVYVFSRKNELEPESSTRDMARDVRKAMDLLGVEKADVLGVSQGGMIAQHFAVDYPERVGKLVLAVTAARPNGQLREVVSHWIELAEQGDYRGLILDSFQKMYTEEYIRKNRWLLTLAGRIGRPDSYERFLIMARACLNHDCYEALGQIRADTLVVGGEKDQVLGGQASREIAGRIGGSELILYPEYGHALYEQAKDFNGRVLDFLRR